MLKALVIKELRESAGILALGILGAIYMLGELTATAFQDLWHAVGAPVGWDSIAWQAGHFFSFFNVLRGTSCPSLFL